MERGSEGTGRGVQGGSMKAQIYVRLSIVALLIVYALIVHWRFAP